MSPNVTLLIISGVLFACGIYLLLERSLTRVLLGLLMLTNGANLLLLTTGGYAGLAPFFAKGTDPRAYSDPLPQAFVLTSIVISFAVTAFMLALIYRTWQLGRADEVADDIEDRRVASQSGWVAEDDADVPADLSEFPSVEEAAAADWEALHSGPREKAYARDADEKAEGSLE
ncbi:Na(+)/H(+) antiporter subunit C [Sinomonas sp. JGH33]|uniref:Na(+)/H(+) antiporter subunit C n=1 Tax=Sinomonas terricola TaxID=3110330 RepID=A0ABU5TC12_9MICC|nr:Na(+)/H(+) antiporter subunit C [Sinomonas sp. JGH33]MEA5457216.1 Na(+)/H(+) antiporter subunit C [Sinomonas sp. JGH33]